MADGCTDQPEHISRAHPLTEAICNTCDCRVAYAARVQVHLHQQGDERSAVLDVRDKEVLRCEGRIV